MKTFFSKTVSLILAVFMIAGIVLPLTAFADDALDDALNVEGGTLVFENSDDYPWCVASDADGRLYGKSGNSGVNGSSSTLILKVTCEETSYFTFDFIAAGEGDRWDVCHFSVDDYEKFAYGARHNSMTWESYIYVLSAGEHEVKWRYTKDGSVHTSLDAFMLDNVALSTVPPQYEIEIDGVTVNYANKDDVLEDGVFRYDPVKKILNVNGDLDADGVGIRSGIDGLTIVVEDKSNINSNGYEGMLLYGDTTITGQPLSIETDVPGILVGAGCDLAVSGGNLDINAGIGILAAEPGSGLTVDFSTLTVTGEPAVKGFESISVSGCDLVLPEGGYIDNGSFYTADGEVADEVFLDAYYAEIYGISRYATGPSSDYDNKWVTFRNVDPSNSVEILGIAPESYAACYAYGRVMGYTDDGLYYTFSLDDPSDYRTYEITFDVAAYDEPVSMTYDYVTGNLFVATDDSYIVEVDPASGATVNVYEFNNGFERYYGIAAGVDGKLYAVTQGAFKILDPSDLSVTAVFDHGLSPFGVQDICYDFNTGAVYWACIASSGNSGLYAIEPSEGTMTGLGTISEYSIDLCGMFIVPDEEPEPVTEPLSVYVYVDRNSISAESTVQAYAYVCPFTAEYDGFTWYVPEGGEDIISVDENGLVTALSEGTAKLGVSVDGTDISCETEINVFAKCDNLFTGYYFENPEEVSAWNFQNYGFFADSRWRWSLEDPDIDEEAYEGFGALFSATQYDGTDLEADELALSPSVYIPEDANTEFSFWARSDDVENSVDHIYVYAGDSNIIYDMDRISSELTVTGEYTKFTFDLSGYAGQSIRVLIRHTASTFNEEETAKKLYTGICIDAVEFRTNDYDYEIPLSGLEVYPDEELTVFAGYSCYVGAFMAPIGVVGYEIEREISDENVISIDEKGLLAALKPGIATVTYSIPGTDICKAITVKVLPPLGDLVYGTDFTDDPVLDGWTFVNADADNNEWYWHEGDYYYSSYEGTGCIYSDTYDYYNDEDLEPDDWAISPLISIPESGSTVLTVAAGTENGYFGTDRFAVYVGFISNINYMEPVGETFEVKDFGEYFVDLTAFAGEEVFIAIRHFDSSGETFLFVDSFEVRNNSEKYVVSFVDIDGTVISEAEYGYLEEITVPDDPEKADDMVGSYEFTGWSPAVNAECYGEVTYTATYNITYNEYIVTFVDEDGTELAFGVYRYGDELEFPEDPDKDSDNVYYYEFAGWSPEAPDTCEGDATYTATYEACYLDYSVSFYDDDGNEIANGIYHYGDELNVPEAPEKLADETYTYVFAGWSPELSGTCDGTEDYYATYTAVYIDYTVTFVDDDGTVISTATYHYGEDVGMPADPEKPADNTYTYVFAGWSPEVSETCEGNATYTATYTATNIDYTVTFVDDDGTVISTATYHYGDEITVPADPTKAADNTYTYVFAGWSPAVPETCEGDATFTATYTATYIDYTVTFVDEDGTVLATYTFHYGEDVGMPDDPEKPADNTYTYVFAGWSPAVPETCEGDLTFTATYTATYIDYTVTFVDEDGTVICSDAYHYGEEIVMPADPEKPDDNTYYYVFDGWTPEVPETCEGNATFTATYTNGYIEYLVSFLDEEGNEISCEIYHYGDELVIPEAPEKPADDTFVYEFAGWSPAAPATCEGDADYYAAYTAKLHATRDIDVADAFGAGQTSIVFGKATVGESILAVKPAEYLLGDVNGADGITAVDYLMAKRAVLGTYTLSAAEKLRADVDGNGEVTAVDYLMIKRHVLGTYTIVQPEPELEGDLSDYVVIVVDAEGKITAVNAEIGEDKAGTEIGEGGYAIVIHKDVLENDGAFAEALENAVGFTVTLENVDLTAEYEYGHQFENASFTVAE